MMSDTSRYSRVTDPEVLFARPVANAFETAVAMVPSTAPVPLRLSVLR